MASVLSEEDLDFIMSNVKELEDSGVQCSVYHMCRIPEGTPGYDGKGEGFFCLMLNTETDTITRVQRIFKTISDFRDGESQVPVNELKDLEKKFVRDAFYLMIAAYANDKEESEKLKLAGEYNLQKVEELFSL